MWVCLCMAVNCSTVRAAIDSGATSVKQITAACGAGKDCTMCQRNLRALLRDHLASQSPAEEPT